MIRIILFSWNFKRIILFLIYKTNVFVKLLKLMLEYFYYLILFIFLRGFYVFVSLRKYLLSILLSLEFIILRLFILLYIYIIYNNFEIYILIIFLIFIVCEGSLGLSILVSIIRSYGNNFFQSFRILKC